MREIQAEYDSVATEPPSVTAGSGRMARAATDPLTRMRGATAEFLHIGRDDDRSLDSVLHATAAALHRFAAAAGACERAGLAREDVLPHLGWLRVPRAVATRRAAADLAAGLRW